MSIMRVVRIRYNLFIIYLVCLFFYGIVMMFSTFENDATVLTSDSKEEEINNDSTFTLNIFRKRRRSKRGSGNNAVRPIASVDDFFQRLHVPETFCTKMVDVGGSSCGKTMDNNKLVCLDEDVRLRSRNCTIYSFGIGDDMTFDHEMYKYGCEVYMFDSTIPSDTVKDNLRDRLQFFHLGLHVSNFIRHFEWEFNSEDQDERLEYNVTGIFDTFTNIRKRISHEGKVVDYLKMDIDGSEWYTIPDMIKNNNFANIKQFALEMHANEIINKTDTEAVMLLQDMWTKLQLLKTIGFERASYVPTLVLESIYRFPGQNRSVPTCGEILFLRRSYNRL